MPVPKSKSASTKPLPASRPPLAEANANTVVSAKPIDAHVKDKSTEVTSGAATKPAPKSKDKPADDPSFWEWYNELYGKNLAAGSKRKSDEPLEEESGFDDSDSDCVILDLNCDQVRRMIRRFLDSGAMKVGKFCKLIGVSNKSLNDFLRQSGHKGSGSSTYQNAGVFFKKRELAGAKIPNKKQKTAPAAASNFGQSSAKAAAPVPANISTIELPGQYDDDVSVYDSCDEIRKKISAHLVKPGVTKAQFCRDLRAQLFSLDAPKSIQSAQLDGFRSKKGPLAGNTGSAYYAAYVFFEKMRIAEGKPKSKHRLDMEDIHVAGVDRVHNTSRGVWVIGSKRPVEDQFGRVSFW